jgi:hypothetical protein
MQQTAGESPHQRTLSRALPRDLVDEAYVLIPRRGNFTSRLEHQEATITYLSVWLGDGQPVTFYAPPSAGGFRLNGTLGECTGLPWIVDRFYVCGLDRDFRENRVIRRALDDINSRTQWLDDHPDIKDHPNEVQAPNPAAGPSA